MTTENKFSPRLEVVTDYVVQLSVTKPGQIRFLFNPIVGIYESGMVWCKSRGEDCSGCKFLESCPRPEGAGVPIEGRMIPFTDLPIELKKHIKINMLNKEKKEEAEKIEKVEHKFENCAEGYGAPDNLVEVTVYESGKVETKVVGSKDDEILKR